MTEPLKLRRRIPSLNWLRVFEAAARLESFARAADVLNMSTSAVSQQVKALESHLRTDLFLRGPRHVTLTDAGHAFLPAVRQSIQTVEETASSLFGETRDSTLTLQCVLVFATGWLAQRLPQFSAEHPEVQLHMSGIYHDLDYQRPGSDLQILFGPVHRSWGQCDKLFEETVYPVATQEIAAQIHSPADFMRQRLIQVSAHKINWNRLLQSQGIEDIPTHQFCFADTTEIALTLAATGNGIALARAPTTHYLVDKLDLVECLPGSGLHSDEAYYLTYRNLESLTNPAQQFRRWLIDQC
ncbi:MAG: LysR family transcriptional regulator [Pseudomonadota bacterium]